MTWNYRVVRRVLHQANGIDADGEAMFGVHEAYYDDEVQQPHSITRDPVVEAGTMVELRIELAHMLLALDKPVLEYDEIGDGKE